MADKQYYMSNDGTVVEEKDYKFLRKHVKNKKTVNYEKAFKIEETKNRQKKTR